MNGFSLIEVLIALTLLSFIAVGTSQYFVWMTSKSRANFDRSQSAVLQVEGRVQNKKRQRQGTDSDQGPTPVRPELPNQHEYG